jgi:hypothetical protein
MFLLYVDESGDTGMKPGGSPYFGLSALVIHELAWRSTAELILAFRRRLRDRYGLKLREEIHVSAFLRSPGELVRIPKSVRLRILREVLDFMESLPDANLLHVLVKKGGKTADYDVFDKAWQAMLQRFHNTIASRKFPGRKNSTDYGAVFADQTDEQKLRRLIRKMRRYSSEFGNSRLSPNSA